MRIKAKTDNNHKKIIDDLRKIGASVVSTHNVGSGFCDIVVGYRGRNYLFEIKSHKNAKLTQDELKFSQIWNGQYHVIYSFDDAFRVINKR